MNGLPAGEAPAQGAASAGEGEKPEPGGIFGLGDAGLPVALAEGQQDGGIGDPRDVVGDGDASVIAMLFNPSGPEAEKSRPEAKWLTESERRPPATWEAGP